MLKLDIVNGANIRYDDEGRLVYFEMGIPNVTYNKKRHIYYDDKGRVVKIMEYKNWSAPSIYTYEYDDMNRITSIIETIAGHVFGTELYEYNENGNTTVHVINGVMKHITIANSNMDIIDDKYIYDDGMINHLTREYDYDNKTFIETISHINTKIENDIITYISKYSFENDEVKLIEKIKE